MVRVAGGLFGALLFCVPCTAYSDDGLALFGRELNAVMIDHFCRAETDNRFAGVVKSGGFERFVSDAELPAERDLRWRRNRDLRDARAVWDMDSGPLTVKLPDSGERYAVLQVINQDHQLVVLDAAKREHLLTRDIVGSRYCMTVYRVFWDSSVWNDDVPARALLSAVVVAQDGGQGVFDIPRVDVEQELRFALCTLNRWVPDRRRMFGAVGDTDRLRHVIGTAIDWGALSDADCFQVDRRLNYDGKGAVLTLKEMPPGAFWSVSVYGKDGCFDPKSAGKRSVNSYSAKTDPDGSVRVYFGGAFKRKSNFLAVDSQSIPFAFIVLERTLWQGGGSGPLWCRASDWDVAFYWSVARRPTDA